MKKIIYLIFLVLRRPKSEVKYVALLLAALITVSCGVRGDPVPPNTPSYLGRGQPTYKGATEDLKFPTVPPVYAPQNKEEEKKDEKTN